MRKLPDIIKINITLKFMGVLFLVSLIPLLVVGGVSYHTSSKIIQDEIRNYTAGLVHGQRDYLDLYLQAGENLIANISSVEEITNILPAPYSDTYTNLATQARIGYILNNYSNVKGLVSIDIFTLNDVHYHVGDTLSASHIRNNVLRKFFSVVQASGSDVVWNGVEENINADSESRQVITAVKLFTELDAESMAPKPVALLVVNYQIDYIYNLFAHLDLGKDSYLMIIDQQNRIVFHPEKTLIGQSVDQQILDQLTGEEGSKVVVIDSRPVSVTYARSETSGWLIAGFIPVETLSASTLLIGRTSLLTLFISIILMGIMGAVYARNLANPIREITNAFRLYENSGAQAIDRLAQRGQDEIGELIRWFNTFLVGQEARSAAEKRLRQREHYLSLLNEITLTSLQNTDIPCMLDILAERIGELIDADGAYITLWDETRQVSIPTAASDQCEVAHKDIVTLPGEQTMTASVLQAGRTLVEEDTLNSPYVSRRIAASYPERSILGLPLIADGRKLGAVLIGYKAPHHFSADEIALCEQAANLISLSLARATLLEETRRFNEDLEIRISDRTLQLEAANKALEAERASLANRVAERTAELSAANVELARAVRAKDEFLTNMSHELRTPLNAILGFSEVLQDGAYGPLTEQQNQILETIFNSGEHLLSLINDILDLSKFEAGKFELHLGWVDVQQLCQASHQFIKHQALKKSIGFSLEIDGAPPKIYADERRLKQILVNLLSNAVKFTPNGGQIGLTVKPNADPEKICFEVWDTGIGITAADQKRLFKPFVQIDGSLSRQHEGTGLGLSLVRRLADLHDGCVTLHSQPGLGSRFTVCIPLTKPGVAQDEPAGNPGGEKSPHAAIRQEMDWEAAHATWIEPGDCLQDGAPSPNQPKNGAGRAAPGPGQLILLAEDNEANIHMFRDILQSRGYRVIVARNGIEAEEMALAETPSLVLMDMQMPERDGLETTRRMRAHPDLCAIPIIALTALAMPGDRELGLQAGVNQYLTKPVRLKSLLEVVQSFFQSEQLR